MTTVEVPPIEARIQRTGVCSAAYTVLPEERGAIDPEAEARHNLNTCLQDATADGREYRTWFQPELDVREGRAGRTVIARAVVVLMDFSQAELGEWVAPEAFGLTTDLFRTPEGYTSDLMTLEGRYWRSETGTLVVYFVRIK